MDIHEKILELRKRGALTVLNDSYSIIDGVVEAGAIDGVSTESDIDAIFAQHEATIEAERAAKLAE